MSEIVNDSLKKIFKGTTFVFIGTIVSLFLGLIGRIVLIRFITKSEYGTYSLAFAVVSIFITLSTMGLSEGSTRYIAFFRGKKDIDYVRNIISSSIQIGSITGFLFTIISFFSSDFIAINIFHSAELSVLLKIFSISIPFVVFINIFIAIYRGFDRIDLKIYINDILRSIIYILALLTVILFQTSFFGKVYAYISSTIITCLIFLIYFLKNYSFSITTNNVIRKLLLFSFPLLAVDLLLTTMGITSTLMIGYFETPDAVGIYNAAIPVASFLSVIINSVGYIYTPIMSQLFSKNQIKELGRSYAISTRWSFMTTLPLFFIFFLFPEIITNLIFGPNYIGAGIILQILSLGFIFNSFFGLNYHTLITIGKSNFIMFSTLIGAVVNILLNIILIPSLSIVGAAIGSAIAFLLVEILMTIRLYRDTGIHPFNKNYFKLSILSILIISIFYIVRNFFSISWTFWNFLAMLIMFMLVYIITVSFAHLFEAEDIMLIMTIEKRFGVNLSSIKRLLRL